LRVAALPLALLHWSNPLQQSFGFAALFRPARLHVFVSFITHRAVLFAAGSASLFAFVDVSNQTVFGHVVSKIFFKFDAKYVKISVLS
jgi:hypothetical protein